MPAKTGEKGQLPTYTEKSFPEQEYLAVFPDIGAAIRQGLFKTGFEHFRKTGRSELASGQRSGFPMPKPVTNGGTAAMPATPAAAAGERLEASELTCFIDEIADGRVSGWVRNKGRGYPVLTLVIDRQDVLTFVADGPRPDVLATYPGSLYVGFRFNVPHRFLNGRVRRMEIALESGAPIDMVFQGRRSTTVDFASRRRRRVLSNVDGMSQGYIKGWVLSDEEESGELKGGSQVLVTMNGARVTQLRANLYRPDVGKGHGADPYCGFEFQPPEEYRLSGTQSFGFKVVPDNIELSGSPMTAEFVSGRTEELLGQLTKSLEQLAADVTHARRELQKLRPTKIYTIHDYNEWSTRYFPALRQRAAKLPRDIAGAKAHASDPSAPTISIVCPVYQPHLADFMQAVESVINQTFTDWELILVDDGSKDRLLTAYLDELPKQDQRIKVFVQAKNGGISAATNAALAQARGAWIGFMDHDDLLVDVALRVMLAAAVQNDALVLYCDEDKVDRNGDLSAPQFKPDWNYRLMLGVNYVCHFLVVRKDIVDKVGKLDSDHDGAQDHDFILRLSELVDGTRFHHVPEMLYHWRITEGSTATEIASKPYAINAGIGCVSAHLERTGRRAVVRNFKESTLYKVTWQNLVTPKVSIIIPFKDEIETTRMCLSRILELTQYADFEVILVDNWSTSEDRDELAMEVESMANVRILRVEEPFNYSRLNNLAAAQSDAKMYVFMNNDLFVKDRLWLRTIVNEALSDAKVAAVGGKFFYPNGSIQHAGVVLGIGGVAGHVHNGLRADDGGYGGRAFFAQELSAVTAACMLVRAEIFKEVGGFDEEFLKVAFNDIDFCLKCRAAGYKVIWTPEFVADHHESLSRGSDERPETRGRFFHETQTMIERWGDLLKNDPFYSRHFDLVARPFFDLVDPAAEGV